MPPSNVFMRGSLYFISLFVRRTLSLKSSDHWLRTKKTSRLVLFYSVHKYFRRSASSMYICLAYEALFTVVLLNIFSCWCVANQAFTCHKTSAFSSKPRFLQFPFNLLHNTVLNLETLLGKDFYKTSLIFLLTMF